MSDKQNELVLAGPLKAVFDNPEQVRENIKIFRESLPKLLDPKTDITILHGKPFKNKTGWNVILGYFGVHSETIRSWVTELSDGEFAVNVSVRVFSGPNSAGRSGTCTSMEMKEKHHGENFAALYSHCYGMAETRGIERAAIAYFMDADVGAEEAEGASTPMQKEEQWCLCEYSKVEFTTDGKGCRTCKKQIREIKIGEILKKYPNKGKKDGNKETNFK